MTLLHLSVQPQTRSLHCDGFWTQVVSRAWHEDMIVDSKKGWVLTRCLTSTLSILSRNFWFFRFFQSECWAIITIEKRLNWYLRINLAIVDFIVQKHIRVHLWRCSPGTHDKQHFPGIRSRIFPWNKINN